MALTSLERVRRAIGHLQPDVVPVGPYMGNHGARVGGYKLVDYYTNGTNMAKAQYRAWEIYGQDIVVAQSDNYYIAQGFGCEIETYEDSTPTVKKYAIESIFDADRLKVPNPLADGRMPVYLEAIQLLSQRLGGSVCVRAPGTGPLALAAHLIGAQEFLTHIAEAEYCGQADVEAAVFRLMDLTSDALIAFCQAALAAGAHVVQCGDSLASLDMISPAIYQKYAFPYEKKVFDAVRPAAQKAHAAMLLHICGDNTKVMELLADTGADILDVDSKVDIGHYKRSIGGKVCLMGNLDPTGILLRGTAEDVQRASQECIEKAAADGGFILGSGCEVPIHTPVENIKAMIAVARGHAYRAD